MVNLSSVLTIDSNNEIKPKENPMKESFSLKMFLWFKLIDDLKRIPTDQEWFSYLIKHQTTKLY